MTNNNTHHRVLNLLALVLPRRGTYRLLLAVALVGSGLAVASFSRGIVEADAAATAATASVPAAILPAVVLPTVVVRPEPEIPTLATVTVRSGDGVAQNERSTLRVARLLPVHAVTSFASAGSAGSGFGMPYYSFGKPLHHGTEE